MTKEEHIQKIKDFIKENYRFEPDTEFEILEKKRNFIVNSNQTIFSKYPFPFSSLTENLFSWGCINGDFNCCWCKELQTLQGSPQECEDFDCSGCENLISLEGAPRECRKFDCRNNEKLSSLKASPQKCKYYYLSNCKHLNSLEGAPKKCKMFYCEKCPLLISLEGAPQECDDFYCIDCSQLKPGTILKCQKEVNICSNIKIVLEPIKKAHNEHKGIGL